MKKKLKIQDIGQQILSGEIKQYKETPKLRKERVSNQKGLYIRVVKSKKIYNRKREKRKLYGKNGQDF